METAKSADGTVIAYDRTGDGPPLVVVVGALCDRHTFVSPSELTGRFTVCTYDRRGRGDSGDTQLYSPDREIEDLAAVVETAGAGGSGVFAYGHSSGAALALQAAARGVPFGAMRGSQAPHRTRGGWGLADGRSGRPNGSERRRERLRVLGASPTWAGLGGLAPTLPYDLAVAGD